MLSSSDAPGESGGGFSFSAGSCAVEVWLNEKLGRGGGLARNVPPNLKSLFKLSAPGSACADCGRRPFVRENPEVADAGARAGKTKGGFGSGGSVLIFGAE